MAAETIKCPDCGASIPLTKALTKEIEASLKIKSDEALEKLKDKLQEEAKKEESRLEEKFEKDKDKIEVKIRKELEAANSVELEDLQADLEEKTKSLATANEKELEHRREKRELEDRAKNAELEADRKLEAEREKIIEKAIKDAEGSHELKDAEKDRKLTDALTQVENLKRRIEQGSQKMQGEVFETQLQERLGSEFPFDVIGEVAPGIKGGDILQAVKTRSGVEVGKILWELKRTKSFSESWIPKLKADGRACKADVCLLVSETLPDNVNEFAERQGVWCSSMDACIPLAHVLREMLIKVEGERSVQTGKKDKAELVYEYLTSNEFKGRIEAIIEAFRAMKEDLDSEKRAVERMFAKREKQIQMVVLNVAGMHGDLAALAGNALPTIKILELPKK